MVRESMARRRQRAREAGLCCICCKQRPNPERVVCAPCSAANVKRNKRRRQKIRERHGPRQVLIGHERAGDVAREHDFHAAAAQHYQDALDAVTVTNDAIALPEDIDRIAEKLIQVLFLSGDPDTTHPWYDRLLAVHLATGNNAKAIDIMLKIARQLGIESRNEEASSFFTQAIQLAEKSNENGLWMQANLVMHNHCIILGRYDEATKFMNNVRGVGDEHAASLRISYYRQRAIESAVSGQREKAYRFFEQALPIAKKENNLYNIVSLWQDYSHCALILGDIDLAKSYTERALLISRQHRFVWYIPFLCLEYANILTLLSQPSSAYEYLLEALSCDARVPVLERALAETGIPLALQMNDEVALAKCSSLTVLTRVFRSGEPENMSSVTAAFAKLHNARGDKKHAQALLHQAVEVVCPTAYGWDLPLEIARHGVMGDIPRARMLLEARIVLPGSVVARACLRLFDAHIAQRQGSFSEAHTHAKAAADQFEALNWHAYADEARLLLPYAEDTQYPSRAHLLPFTGMQSVLTKREQQVAGFVLRGLTNRAIAAELSIRENTVEKHMTSIMSLEIRSRHQLAAAIDRTKMQPATVNRFRVP